LKLEPSCTREEVRVAYRAAIKQVHPDVNRHPRAEATAQALNEARRVLADPGLREEYDVARRRCHAARARRASIRSSIYPVPPAPQPAPSRPTVGWWQRPELLNALAAVLRAAAQRRRPSQPKVMWKPGKTRDGKAVCYRTPVRKRTR